jgi:WD40 repeat protein
MCAEKHSDREARADLAATAADRGDPSACTVGADSADSGPADLGAVSRDGTLATLGTGAAAGDATRGPADLTATPGAGATAGAATDAPGSHAGAGDAVVTPRTEPTSGPPPDPASATVNDRRVDGATVASVGAPREATALRAASAIPGYEIVGELGRGGMGVVYRARQILLNRAVALKMILAGQHAGGEAAARFLAEAEAVAKLQHPNIVQIFHIDEHDGFPFFEMEFVGGGSLADRLDGTPRPAREAARLVETLARAMAEAHRRGVVHRDLKPGNILLTPEGVPKVADFGLAKLVDVESGLTRTDSVLGSPSYMAPEQAEDKNKGIGPAADLYALGAILYELLVGRPPFRGATVLETLNQVKTAEPVSPSRLVPGLPRDLETIALKCLQKEPPRRYASADALGEDLRRFLAGEPIAARPVGAAERAWRWCKRNPALAGLMAAVATLLVAVAAGATAAAFRESRSNKQLETSLYFHRIALAHRELSVDNLGRALRLLDECPKDLRRWEWDYLNRLCRVDPLILHDPGNREVTSVAFSPDGERLAAAGGDGTVKVWNCRTCAVVRVLDAQAHYVFSVAFHPEGRYLASAGANREVRVWDLTTGTIAFTCPGYTGAHIGTAYGVAFSPDGRHLAAGSDGAVNIWDWRNRQLLHALPGHAKRGGICVAFSPDGRRLASGSWRGSVMIWDAETGERLHTLSGHLQPVSALAFSPDGGRLVSVSFDKYLMVWDTTSGRRLDTRREHDGLSLGVAFSPDGARLATVGEDKTVRVWDSATGQEALVLRGHTDMSQCVAFSPDGRRLASCGRDGTIRFWDATPLQENERQEALTFSQQAEAWNIALSPDGRWVASTGQAAPDRLAAPVKVWDVRSGGEGVEFTGHAGVAFCVAWHPDGQRIASAGQDNERDFFVVKVWDARTGQVAFALPGGAETLTVAFSPDGRHLVTGGGGSDRAVQVWDAQTGREVGSPGAHDREIRGLAFSPDGRYLSSASADGTVKLWDATQLGEKQEARRTLRARSGQIALNTAFSPEGRRLVTGGEENTVKIWDLQTGQELQTLRGHKGDVWAVAFSPDPDGRWVASAGEDSTVKLWDSHTGALVRNFRGHTGLVSSIAFSPDGRLLLSGSRDKTVKVWDVTPLHQKHEE